MDDGISLSSIGYKNWWLPISLSCDFGDTIL